MWKIYTYHGGQRGCIFKSLFLLFHLFLFSVHLQPGEGMGTVGSDTGLAREARLNQELTGLTWIKTLEDLEVLSLQCPQAWGLCLLGGCMWQWKPRVSCLKTAAPDGFYESNLLWPVPGVTLAGRKHWSDRVQDTLPQNTVPWHIDYFKRKEFDQQLVLKDLLTFP